MDCLIGLTIRDSRGDTRRMPRLFKTAKQNRVFQDVVDQIQESILRGRLKTGQMLPPERELREQFAVSRGTLREALRVVEQKGLIRIKLGAGGGAEVQAPGNEQMSESLALLIQSRSVSLKHLSEFREALESEIAAKASERARSSDLPELWELLRQADGILSAKPLDWRAFVSVDGRFHQALARLTGNPMYISVLQTIQDNIHPYYDRFLPKDKSTLTENYHDLVRLLEAVQHGKGQAAADLARSHVQRFNRYMKRIEQSDAHCGQEP